MSFTPGILHTLAVSAIWQGGTGDQSVALSSDRNASAYMVACAYKVCQLSAERELAKLRSTRSRDYTQSCAFEPSKSKTPH